MKQITAAISLKTVLVIELALGSFFATLSALLPTSRDHVTYPACMCAVAFLCHVVLVPVKGLSYVIHDEDPDSPYKYYWFSTIALFVVIGKILNDFILGY